MPNPQRRSFPRPRSARSWLRQRSCSRGRGRGGGRALHLLRTLQPLSAGAAGTDVPGSHRGSRRR